jgi:hypothetical protein
MRFVDRRMHVRGIEPVAVLIGVEEQAALPHLVGEGPMPGTKCAGLKAACPKLAKEVP